MGKRKTKEEMEEFINETITLHRLVKINNQLYLKQYQKELLDLYHIPYQNCSSIKEILFLLEEENSEELEELANSLQEFSYYHETNK